MSNQKNLQAANPDFLTSSEAAQYDNIGTFQARRQSIKPTGSFSSRLLSLRAQKSESGRPRRQPVSFQDGPPNPIPADRDFQFHNFATRTPRGATRNEQPVPPIGKSFSVREKFPRFLARENFSPDMRRENFSEQRTSRAIGEQQPGRLTVGYTSSSSGTDSVSSQRPLIRQSWHTSTMPTSQQPKSDHLNDLGPNFDEKAKTIGNGGHRGKTGNNDEYSWIQRDALNGFGHSERAQKANDLRGISRSIAHRASFYGVCEETDRPVEFDPGEATSQRYRWARQQVGPEHPYATTGLRSRYQRAMSYDNTFWNQFIASQMVDQASNQHQGFSGYGPGYFINQHGSMDALGDAGWHHRAAEFGGHQQFHHAEYPGSNLRRHPTSAELPTNGAHKTLGWHRRSLPTRFRNESVHSSYPANLHNLGTNAHIQDYYRNQTMNHHGNGLPSYFMPMDSVHESQDQDARRNFLTRCNTFSAAHAANELRLETPTGSYNPHNFDNNVTDTAVFGNGLSANSLLTTKQTLGSTFGHPTSDPPFLGNPFFDALNGGPKQQQLSKQIEPGPVHTQPGFGPPPPNDVSAGFLAGLFDTYGTVKSHSLTDQQSILDGVRSGRRLRVWIMFCIIIIMAAILVAMGVAVYSQVTNESSTLRKYYRQYNAEMLVLDGDDLELNTSLLNPNSDIFHKTARRFEQKISTILRNSEFHDDYETTLVSQFRIIPSIPALEVQFFIRTKVNADILALELLAVLDEGIRQNKNKQFSDVKIDLSSLRVEDQALPNVITS